MSDPGLLNIGIGDIPTLLGAVAALGGAAAGLVDSAKSMFSGLAGAGFKKIIKGLTPFNLLLDATALERKDWKDMLRGPWLNGVALEDQITKAKAMVLEGLSPTTVANTELEFPTRIDRTKLATLATALDNGEAPTDAEKVVSANFNLYVDAVVRAAYNHGDKAYRHNAQTWAGLVAIVLAVAGGWIVYVTQNPKAGRWDYIGTHQFWLALVVGAVAVPLAPIAKNLATALQTAVQSMQSAYGKSSTDNARHVAQRQIASPQSEG